MHKTKENGTPAHEVASLAHALLQPEQLRDMGHSEYDAAWVARVPTPEGRRSAFPEVLRVVRETQALDGGWAPDVDYISARILATLASMLAITEFDPDAAACASAEKAASYVLQAWQRLNPQHELTIGFELLAPTLIRDVCRRGLPLGGLLEAADALQQEKLKRLPEALVYDPHLSASFSLEFLGDRLDPERAMGVRLKNGSIGASVAATAYFAARTGDPSAMAYLRNVVETYGAQNVPYGSPATLWPTMWALYQLNGARIEIDSAIGDKLLSHIHRSFNSEGITWCEDVEYADSDCTAMALMVLHQGGREGNWSLLNKFEGQNGFLCLQGERGPSVSVNAHVLQAMTRGLHLESHRMALKAADFLIGSRQREGHWIDKWHASPYYPTSRAILGLLAFDRDSPIELSLEWLLATQRSDGSWGHYGRGTPEETAYAIHALKACFEAGHSEVKASIATAGAYLETFDGTEKEAHPKLWISKVLYRPLAVVRSAVISAQAIARRITGSIMP